LGKNQGHLFDLKNGDIFRNDAFSAASVYFAGWFKKEKYFIINKREENEGS